LKEEANLIISITFIVIFYAALTSAGFSRSPNDYSKLRNSREPIGVRIDDDDPLLTILYDLIT
jgi:hypothetical protein